MIGSDALVAIRDVGFRTQELCAKVGHVVLEIVRILRHDLHMFIGQFIGGFDHFLVSIANDNLAIFFPGNSGNICGRQNG